MSCEKHGCLVEIDCPDCKQNYLSIRRPRCKICDKPMSDEEDCGGDCLKCMAEIGEDPDCIEKMNN